MAGEARRQRLRALLRLAGVRGARGLADVEHAFVHESYARERGGTSNERLEFLGDSVLGFITSTWLFESFGDEPEGMLTQRKAAIVNDARLAESARRLGFSGVMQLGAGLRSGGGDDNTSVLADAFEAFVAVLYERYGIEKARHFVLTQHVELLDHSGGAPLDAKSRLQHYAQAHLSATPVYRETNRGTPQQPSFNSRVTVKGKTLGTGTGPSKKSAQQAAAEAALLALQPTA